MEWHNNDSIYSGIDSICYITSLYIYMLKGQINKSFNHFKRFVLPCKWIYWFALPLPWSFLSCSATKAKSTTKPVSQTFQRFIQYSSIQLTKYIAQQLVLLCEFINLHNGFSCLGSVRKHQQMCLLLINTTTKYFTLTCRIISTVGMFVCYMESFFRFFYFHLAFSYHFVPKTMKLKEYLNHLHESFDVSKWCVFDYFETKGVPSNVMADEWKTLKLIIYFPLLIPNQNSLVSERESYSFRLAYLYKCADHIVTN